MARFRGDGSSTEMSPHVDETKDVDLSPLVTVDEFVDVESSVAVE